MIVRAVVAALLVTGALVPVSAAQEPVPPVPVASLQAPVTSVVDEVRDTVEPLRRGLLDTGALGLSLGPTGDGSLAAVVSGRQRTDLGGIDSAVMVDEDAGFAISSGGYLEYAVDGVWTDAVGDTEVLNLSLRPSLDLVFSDWKPGAAASTLSREQAARCEVAAREFLACGRPRPSYCEPLNTPRALSAISAFADLRYRNAQTELAGTRGQLKQQMLGAGLEWYLPVSTASVWFQEFPRLSVTYLKPQQTEATTELAASAQALDVAFYSATARLRMNVPLLKRTRMTPSGCASIDYPLQVHADVSGSRAEAGELAGWKTAWSVRLVFDAGGALLPVLEHRGGTELGLEHDERWVLGLMWPLGSRPLN